MKQRVILVAGKKRAGKDEITKRIIKKYTNNCYQITSFSFAKKLKEYSCDIAEISLDEMDKLKNEDGTFLLSKELYKKNYLELIKKVHREFGFLFDKSKDLFEAEFMKTICINKLMNDDFSIINEKNTNPIMLEIDARKFLQRISVLKVLFGDDDIWAKLTVIDMKKQSGILILSDYRFPNEKQCLIDEGFKVKDLLVIGKNYFDVQTDLHESETALNSEKFDYVINNMSYNNKSINAQINAIMKGLTK